MALLNPTFIFGILVLLYLFTFVLFALLRIATGISIQRIGYFSLRHIAYTPKDGIKIDIRGLGLLLHRPTFAQPTWISVVLEELRVTIDLKLLNGPRDADGPLEENGVSTEENASTTNSSIKTDPDTKRPLLRRSSSTSGRSRTWETLTDVKEKIKRLHRKINWIRTVDLVATNTILNVVEVGSLQVGGFTMAVDTRRKTVDRGRLFRHGKKAAPDHRPAEWMFTVRSVLFIPEGKDALEILDHCSLNVHGILYQQLDGLRDASISLKLGRVRIPYDDIMSCMTRLQNHHDTHGTHRAKTAPKISLSDVMEELEMPGTREEKIVQTVSDSKEFVSSILRGISDVQFALSFLGLTKKIPTTESSSSPTYLNISMKAIGIDVHRLDSNSPVHRMYFTTRDIAHQALFAAISIAAGIEDSNGNSEKLLYLPMATATVKTTLPSKTLQSSQDNDAAERNANILFANLVFTSPSLDLHPKHLPLLVEFFERKEQSGPSFPTGNRHHLISRLLPKASIKLSIQEPVVRVTLPSVGLDSKGEDEYDLLISSISSIALDVESSHSAAGELHYALGSSLRITLLQLYYQAASGSRHDLLLTESLELKVHVNATPEVRVVASGDLRTFSLHLVRPEISDGIRQIVKQLKTQVEPAKLKRPRLSHRPNFLRRMPPWLLHFQLQGSDFGIEIAGVDPEISKDARGVALQLESWTAEYKAQKAEPASPRHKRHRAASQSLNPDQEFLKVAPPLLHQQHNATDGRRLAVHGRGLEAFAVQSLETWEHEPFLSLPRFEVAASTSTDSQGQVFHINSYIKTLFLHYSLYRHYAIGVATTVLMNAFVKTSKDVEESIKANERRFSADMTSHDRVGSPEKQHTRDELITVDIKAGLVQIKASMPADPPMMLQVFLIEAGRHRWTSPFIKASLIRLCAEAPRMNKIWARLVTTKNLRVDLREAKRKTGASYHDEKSIDVVSESIRIAVPHQLILHRVVDNFVNVAKATEQLHHRFQTGTNEYILDKPPSGPKRVPKISLRSRSFIFELEDGAFEWKLSLIYRIGLTEQKQRLAREEAFRAKVKRILEQDQKRGSSRFRSRSAHPRDHSASAHHGDFSKRSQSNDRVQSRADTHSDHHNRKFRYDPEGTCGLSHESKITVQQARQRLQEYHAQSWKKRIDFGLTISQRLMKNIRDVVWGPYQIFDEMEDADPVLDIPQRPALMSTIINDLHVVVDKPTFPIGEYAEFLHKIGKGMPYDTKYSLLVPMNLQIEMGEARMSLRDYPLPLLHVPALRSNQSGRFPSFVMKTDFVIAEEYRDSQSQRHVKVTVVPPDDSKSDHKKPGFAIDVRRTVSPVKTYSNVNIDINTGHATRITWGTSYQPAIQDMMMIVESFTKPQVDPSDRTGFWDKIRLVFHSRLNVAWKGDGDVHLMLKGSRDPYSVTGHGTGFVMCWRNDVRWSICQDEDPKKFMTVDSGEYVLAIPDLSHQARQSIDVSTGRDRDSISSLRDGAMFKKVVMKLSGNVRWLAGLVFERNIDKNRRTFDFIPHYAVTLKNPEFAKASKGKIYDAFDGFRSQHIHLSIAVVAPLDRDWSVNNLKPSASYNTVHLTPRFFTHFFNWWSLFSGVMSLPIRQGKLWPGVEKSSKKFGRHLATIKYNLLLSPLFMSHIYKHKDAEDYGEEVVSATGLKMRLDSFMLDLHQRREEFLTQIKGRVGQTKTTGMRINQAQLDFISADIRAVSASIAGTTKKDLKRATDETIASYQDPPAVDMSRFTIPDNDFSWIDMDDFVELDWLLPSESNPDTKIMPLAYAPRFTYVRQTDHQDNISGDPNRSSAFGKEPTHYCVMTQDNDPRRVQCDLIRERLEKLDKQMENHRRALGDAELQVIRDDYNDVSLKSEFNTLKHHGETLEAKKSFLQSMLRQMSSRIHESRSRATPDTQSEQGSFYSSQTENDDPMEDVDDTPLADFISDFNNRFIIHNMQMKWNNPLRNIILRYIHQVSQRRGLVYYLSRRAVKFILDIVDEQNKAKAGHDHHSQSPTSSAPSAQSGTPTTTNDDEEDGTVEDRIKQLLDDSKKFVNADDPISADGGQNVATDNLAENIATEFMAQNSYHVRLIAPQIQLQSEKNPGSAVLVTVKGIQLKIVQIMDKDRVADDVSGLVQRRFAADMESLQFFVTNQKEFGVKYLQMYSGNRYGAPSGSSWPPWVPMEVMFDFNINPFGFSRVVQRTSASLRYDKYNTLRLKYNDEVSTGEPGHVQTPDSLESRIDHLWVDFPQVKAICDSAQYYGMYVIVLDLLLYNEPLEKVRTERLEKIMLASDFSDLRGTPEMVIRLQERIRSIKEIKTHFQINAQYLDRQGWEDRLAIEQDLASCEDELFFIMKAITTAQRKYDDRSSSNGLLRWYLSASEIVWHLMRDKEKPLLEFQLTNASYDRTDNSDGSNHNSMKIEKIRGLNLLPEALYPEMIEPYFESTRAFADGRDTQMLRVNWHMLEAIAGIPVMENFEVNLFPLKIQLEREIGKKLFEYIFPSAGSSHPENGSASPFMAKHMQTIKGEDHNGDFRDSAWDGSVNGLDAGDAYSVTASLEQRLKPTMKLPENTRSSVPLSSKSKHSVIHSFGEAHHLRFFHQQDSSAANLRPSSNNQTPSKKSSLDNLRMTSRTPGDRSSTSLSALAGASTPNNKKFSLTRRESTRLNGDERSNQASDDLTQMMSRASNYMTLAYVKIPSVVLCLSYKGKGDRNIEDVNNFVFRMPVLEYRNKTWSNLDLAMQLKKDVIKALISHTGSIIGNKFSHHRPNKAQQSKLREIANSSSILSDTAVNSESSSIRDLDQADYESSDSLPRRSFSSIPQHHELKRVESFASSMKSMGEKRNSQRPDDTWSIGADTHEEGSSSVQSKLSRHFIHLGSKTKDKQPEEEDSEESTQKKSKLLLGKKILRSLN